MGKAAQGRAVCEPKDGIEPTARVSGLVRILHYLNDARYAMERVMGIEPTFSAWEADVLPLNYTRLGTVSLYPP